MYSNYNVRPSDFLSGIALTSHWGTARCVDGIHDDRIETCLSERCVYFLWDFVVVLCSMQTIQLSNPGISEREATREAVSRSAETVMDLHRPSSRSRLSHSYHHLYSPTPAQWGDETRTTNLEQSSTVESCKSSSVLHSLNS
jgi:hypothetical protein